MASRSFLVGLAIGLALMVTAPMALAAPDITDTQSFTEPDFGAFSGTKTVEIYADSNPTDPFPGDGKFTYVYTVTNDGSSLLPIIGVQIQVVPGCTPATIGFFPGVHDPDPPGGAMAGAEVEWNFTAPFPTDPGIAPGTSSSALYLTSACGPSLTPDLIYSVDSEGGFFANGLCLGPAVLPSEGECNLEVTKEGCVNQPPDSGGDACEGKATKLIFQYTGLGCDATSNLQSPFAQECHGGADGDQPVNIEVYGEKKKCVYHHCWMDKVVYASLTGVNIGDLIVVDAAAAGKTTLGHELNIKIRQANSCGGFLEHSEFVVDCSQPLGPGNQFGSALITSLTSTLGGTVGLPDGEDCVKEINVAPAPHCQGLVKEMKLRYTGTACGMMTNSQSELLATCTDLLSPTVDPVRVIVSNGTSLPPSSTAYVDLSGVNVGDIITVKASDIGASYFTSHTGFWIKNGSNAIIQKGKFDADCDQPLDLGDQFGALQVFSLTTTHGGTVALAEEVEYTYTVTNPNTSTVTNISLDDDQFGNIASGISIPAGDSQTFTTTELIGQTTHNVATATGQIDTLQCDAGTAEDTITVHIPPDPGMVCTSDVQAMLLRYTGPTILGARVDVTAGDGWHTYTVTYNPIDLISGVTVLSKPSEHGYTIDAVAHGDNALGYVTKIKINGVYEKLDTSCGHCGFHDGDPFKSNAPAPLFYSSATSPNWFVVDFTQK